MIAIGMTTFLTNAFQLRKVFCSLMNTPPRPTFPHDWLNLILGKHYFRYIHSCDFTNHFISISQKSPDIGAGHSVGVRRLLLGERQGEAHLLRCKVDTRELRHAGISPLFVDSNQGVTQYNVTGAGLLITDLYVWVWEWGELVEETGPMKPWRQVTSGPLRFRPLSLFLLSSLSSVKPKSLSIFLRNFPY